MSRILLVDDEPLATRTLQTMILEEMPDLEVCSVNSAVEALDLLSRETFDIVVTDVAMPRVSGLELLDQIRKQGNPCYVIVLTAYDSFDYAYKATRYEDVRFILKIEPPEVIMDEIRLGLKRVRQHDAAARNDLRIPESDPDLRVESGTEKQYVSLDDALRWRGFVEQRDLPGLMEAIRSCLLREGYPQGRPDCALLLQMQLRESFGENCLEGIRMDGLTAEAVLLHRAFDSPDAWLERVHALLEALFSDSAGRDDSETDEFFDSINRYLRDHMSEQVSLTQVAEHFSYNSSYLSRIYKQHMGEGIIEHLIRLRVEASCRLLTDRSLSVSEIAEQCGFQTDKYFITVFKRLRGVTPKNWRKTHFMLQKEKKTP